MTTIVGIQKDDHCLIASDSQTTSGGRQYIHAKVQKVIERGSYLIAAAGDAAACDFVMFAWKPPVATKVKDTYQFMVTKFAPTLRKNLKDEGFPIGEDKFEFQLLVSLRGEVFEIADDFAVILRGDGLYSIGSGGPYALGALYAGASYKKAIEIAAKNDIYTGLPAVMHKQDKP